MARYCLIFLFVFLTGCATNKPKPFIIGAQTEPPAGWIDYCKRNITDINCK